MGAGMGAVLWRGEEVGAGGQVCGGRDAGSGMGVGCGDRKVWTGKSSSVRDEVRAGLWKGAGWKRKGRFEMEDADLLKRIRGLYLVGAGVWARRGRELQVYPGAGSNRNSYLGITARGRNLGFVCLKVSFGLWQSLVCG